MSKEILMTDDDLEDLIKATVHNTLIQIGVDHEHPLEMQKDFQHLRDWRVSTDSVKRKSLLTFTGLLISGIVAAVVMAIRNSPT